MFGTLPRLPRIGTRPVALLVFSLLVMLLSIGPCVGVEADNGLVASAQLGRFVFAATARELAVYSGIRSEFPLVGTSFHGSQGVYELSYGSVVQKKLITCCGSPCKSE